MRERARRQGRKVIVAFGVDDFAFYRIAWRSENFHSFDIQTANEIRFVILLIFRIANYIILEIFYNFDRVRPFFH